MQRKKIEIYRMLAGAMVLASLSLTGCATKTSDSNEPAKDATEVTGQALKDSKSIKQSIDYPAMVVADQEAKIIAKASGNAKDVRFNVGDKVKMGDVLARIGDVTQGTKTVSPGINSSQLTQAKIAAEQAGTSLRIAQSNYQNLLISSEKDLNQALISKNQSSSGQTNIFSTTAEALKSAELAYETAKVSTEAARINLENRKKISGQSDSDTSINADLTADSVANTCGSLIENINNITGFDQDRGISISYKTYLGALESNALNQADASYAQASAFYDIFKSMDFNSTANKIDSVIELANKTKTLVDDTKYLFTKTIAGVNLPQSSATGPSLTGLQAAVAGYQTQINAALTQIKGAKQSLTNIGLNNNTNLDALEKANELAKKQEASALQALNSLRAGNKSQQDNAGFNVRSSTNQYESLKSKLDSQIQISKNQVDLSQLQYSNALVALQNLYDNHLAVTPIDGIVTAKNVSDGDAVSPGQLLATVSQTNKVKLQFYVDQASLAYFKLGQATNILDNDGNKYPARITGITPKADDLTKRFLIEVRPDKEDPLKFSAGTVMTVSATITKTAQKQDTIILPLSAIEINQNANNIFIVKDGKAQKSPVTIVRVEGESAEIKVNLPADTIIIVDGNKLLLEGDTVKLLSADNENK